MTKYFIEHKFLHTWLCFDGTLTRDPNDPKILTWDEDWKAEEYLNPLKPKATCDFSGTVVRYDYSSVSLWNAIKEAIARENNGADLYHDFMVTEHLFI